MNRWRSLSCCGRLVGAVVCLSFFAVNDGSGGEVTGKMTLPIVQRPDGTYISEFLGTTQILKTKEERDGLEKNIGTSDYPYMTLNARSRNIGTVERKWNLNLFWLRRLRTRTSLMSCCLRIRLTTEPDGSRLSLNQRPLFRTCELCPPYGSSCHRISGGSCQECLRKPI
jgi:hypothetical protein